MLGLNDLTHDQVQSVERLFETDHTLLVAEMGAGKTIVALTAAEELLAEGVLKRVLVVAPVKVCKNVWATECAKWAQLAGVWVADASGSSMAKRVAAIESAAPIVCINFENLPWLFRTYKLKERFDGLIVDELTKLKNTGGTQFKAIRPRLKDFIWRVGMTGTPVSEDWTGLFGQMLIVDSGHRLGTRKDGYLRRYFYPTDYNEYNWELYDWAAAKIAAAISDVVYTMPDYRHQLPQITDERVYLPLPPVLRGQYDELRKSLALEMAGGVTVTADTEAILSNKLQQCANGFLYGPRTLEGKRGEAETMSDYKIDAARVEIDGILSRGGSVVVCYWFAADLARLLEHYPGSELNDQNIADWNAKKQRVLLLHPKSAGHGLNLYAGGSNILWLGPIWSRDARMQAIARVWRRGQTERVTVKTFMGEGTIDDVVWDRAEGKEDHEILFKQHLMGG